MRCMCMHVVDVFVFVCVQVVAAFYFLGPLSILSCVGMATVQLTNFYAIFAIVCALNGEIAESRTCVTLFSHTNPLLAIQRHGGAERIVCCSSVIRISRLGFFKLIIIFKIKIWYFNLKSYNCVENIFDAGHALTFVPALYLLLQTAPNVSR